MHQKRLNEWRAKVRRLRIRNGDLCHGCFRRGAGGRFRQFQ